MKEILKAGLLTSGGTMLSLLLGALATKIFAIVLGPSGVGLLSILRQLQQVGTTLSTLAGSNAVVQKIASTENLDEQRIYISSILWIWGTATVLFLIVLWIAAPQVAYLTLGVDDQKSVSLVRLCSFSIFFSVGLTFLLSILNGHRALRALVRVQIYGSISGALLAYPVSKMASSGYLEVLPLSSGIAQLFSFIAAFFAVKRSGWMSGVLVRLAHGIEMAAFRHFISIAGATLAAAVISAGSLLFLRSVISSELGLEGAGIFDSSWTVSMMYVGLVTSAFSTYYLPKLSGISDRMVQEEFMNLIMRVTLLVTIPLITTVILVKPWIVSGLYSSEFIGSIDVMRWMLIGDYLKVTSWVMGMFMLSHPNMRMFFLADASWSLLFLGLSVIAIKMTGKLEYVGMIFLFLYALNFLNNLIHIRRIHGVNLRYKTIYDFFIGLFVVLFVSLLTWNEVTVNVSYLIEIIPVLLVLVILLLTRAERNIAFRYLGGILRNSK